MLDLLSFLLPDALIDAARRFGFVGALLVTLLIACLVWLVWSTGK